LIISCTKEELLSKINIVLKAVASKTTMPIIECILITADNEGVRLTANNLELAIETSDMKNDVVIMEKGISALEAKMFLEIIRNLPDNNILIQTDDKNVTTIKSGKSEFKILSLPGEDFPKLPDVEKNIKYETKATVFKNMIKQTNFAVAIEETKPILTGELIEIKEDCLNIVAIDGFRVAFRKTDLINDNENISVVVPSKALIEISRILPDKSEEIISMYFTDNHALFEAEDFTVVSRLLEGEFFKYEQSFINEYTTAVEVSRQEFLNSVERATLISRDSKKNPVELSIEKEKIVITSNTEMGASYEEVLVDAEGDDLKIGFNPRYLIDALKAIDDEKINVKFMSPLSPCIIESVGEGNYKYLILPLRLKN
jgi:DNA polymerase-3 subunit beta